MSLVITREESEAVFGADRLVTVPADRLNPAITHAPTRAFLTEVGLPDVPDFLFAIDDRVATGTRGALEFGSWWEEITDLSPDPWVLIGWFWDDVFLLDGATGEVRVLNDAWGVVQFVNSSLDLFVRFLAFLQRDIARFDLENDDDLREAAASRLLTELPPVDPAAFAEADPYWTKAINDMAVDF